MMDFFAREGSFNNLKKEDNCVLTAMLWPGGHGEVVLPTLFFTQEAWVRLGLYVRQAAGEITGFGKLEPYHTGFLVTAVCLIDQVVSSSQADMKSAAINAFGLERLAAGDDPNVWRLWWHSHADHGVFWSSEDLATIDRLGGRSWLVSLVGNHKGDWLTRLTVAKPIPHVFNDLPIRLVVPTPTDLISEVADEINSKVKPASRRRYRRQRDPGVNPSVIPLGSDLIDGSFSDISILERLAALKTGDSDWRSWQAMAEQGLDQSEIEVGFHERES